MQLTTHVQQPVKNEWQAKICSCCTQLDAVPSDHHVLGCMPPGTYALNEEGLRLGYTSLYTYSPVYEYCSEQHVAMYGRGIFQPVVDFKRLLAVAKYPCA